MKNKYTVQYS